MSHCLGPICLSRTIREGGECHSTVKPAKKSFIMVMFQHSVSNLLHNVFFFFPSFPKVSVVNMVHRQKKGSNVWKSSFGGKTKAQVCRPTFMHNFPGSRHSGRPKEMLISFPSSPGCEGSREGAYGWSHWLIPSVFSPSILWPVIKGGWVSKLVNPAPARVTQANRA